MHMNSGNGIPPSVQHCVNNIVQMLQNILTNGRGQNVARGHLFEQAGANGGNNQLFNELVITAAQMAGFGVDVEGKPIQTAITEACENTVAIRAALLFQSNQNAYQQLSFEQQNQVQQLVNFASNYGNAINNYINALAGGFNNQNNFASTSFSTGGNLLGSFNASPGIIRNTIIPGAVVNANSNSSSGFSNPFSSNAFVTPVVEKHEINVKPITVVKDSVTERNGVRTVKMVRNKPATPVVDPLVTENKWNDAPQPTQAAPQESVKVTFIDSDDIAAVYQGIRNVNFKNSDYHLPIVYDNSVYESTLVDDGKGYMNQIFLTLDEGHSVDFREMEVDPDNIAYHDSHIANFDDSVLPIGNVYRAATVKDSKTVYVPMTKAVPPKEDRAIVVDEILPAVYTTDLKSAIKVTTDNFWLSKGNDQSFQFDVIDSSKYPIASKSQLGLWHDLYSANGCRQFTKAYGYLHGTLDEPIASKLDGELTKEAMYSLNVKMGLFGTFVSFANDFLDSYLPGIVQNYGKEAEMTYVDNLDDVFIGIIRNAEIDDDKLTIALNWRWRVIVVPFTLEDIHLGYDTTLQAGTVKREATPLFYDALDTMLTTHAKETECRNRGLVLVFKDGTQCHVSRGYWNSKAIVVRFTKGK